MIISLLSEGQRKTMCDSFELTPYLATCLNPSFLLRCLLIVLRLHCLQDYKDKFLKGDKFTISTCGDRLYKIIHPSRTSDWTN